MTAATKLIAVASPNNPTGGVATREQLLAIATSAPRAALLVDEAYYEFHGKTVISDVVSSPNLFVARTFSKAYGLAGLRIGILAGPREQMPMVRRVSSPYSVNAVALLALPAALADGEYVASYVAQVSAGRERLEQELTRAGITWWPSEANFRADARLESGIASSWRLCDNVGYWCATGRLIRDAMAACASRSGHSEHRRISCWRRCAKSLAELKLGAEVKA